VVGEHRRAGFKRPFARGVKQPDLLLQADVLRHGHVVEGVEGDLAAPQRLFQPPTPLRVKLCEVFQVEACTRL